MIYIGCHLSVTDGYKAMGETMSRFGGNTFAWFTRNPRGGRTKPVVPKDVERIHVGPVTIYSQLQACDIINDHDKVCDCYRKINAA